MPEFSIADGFYVDAAKPIANQACINLIPQVPQVNGLSRAQLIGTPGITLFATTTTTPSRGRHVMNGLAYNIVNTALCRINSDGTSTSLGTILGSSDVSIADNGVQMCIVVPGSTAYIYTVSGGLVTITDSDFTTTLGPSQQVDFVDGYFVHFNNSSAASTSPIFFVSALKDGTAYDALDFGTAEADPDDITGLHVSRNQLYIGGGQTIEPFANIGGAGFPFQRISGGVVPKGVKAKFSMVEFDDSYVFVGGGLNEQPAVWKFIGSSGQKISTAAIDNIIQALTDAEQEDIFCTVYGEYGGIFLNVHIKDRVLTFDSAASQLSGSPKWHERKSKDRFGRATNWRVNGIMKAYGKTLVTDNQDGRVGAMDLDTYTEYGETINRSFSITPFHAEGENITIAEIELTCESGTAGATDAEPFISRSYSDNARTFDNETPRSLGKQGEYNKRQIWRKDGQLRRFRVYRFVVDAAIKITIIKLDADLVLDAA
jgi:hypothetical protein